MMMQYHDSTWSELPTRMEMYSDGRYYYAATTSGFSYLCGDAERSGSPLNNTNADFSGNHHPADNIGIHDQRYGPACHLCGSHETGDDYHRTPGTSGRITGISHTLDRFRCCRIHCYYHYYRICVALVYPQAEPGAVPEI